MNYKEELETLEWKEKRKIILERDGNQCSKCSKKRGDLLGLDYGFGVLNYDEFTNKGYELNGFKEGEKLELLLNEAVIKCDFQIKDLTKVSLSKLKIAKQWKEPKNPLMFKINSLELICFNEDEYDRSSYFDLNIHHKYYQKGKKAWEYVNDALVTLCVNCHKSIHNLNDIPILDEKGNTIGFAKKCERCDGSGVLLEFKYYFNGVCFECKGRGDNDVC